MKQAACQDGGPRNLNGNKEVTTMIRTINTFVAAHAADSRTNPEHRRRAVEAGGTG
jgi:hypothetical protein